MHLVHDFLVYSTLCNSASNDFFVQQIALKVWC